MARTSAGTGARGSAWTLGIPIVLNLLVILILPQLYQENTAANATLVAVAALGTPWVLAALIGRILRSVVEDATRAQEERHDRDFV